MSNGPIGTIIVVQTLGTTEDDRKIKNCLAAGLFQIFAGDTFFQDNTT
jgi:hypothetical protein